MMPGRSSGTRPTFLFIGPDKTGSSWLTDVLRQHPECYVPRIKDIYFFDRYYNRGLSWYFQFFAAAPVEARSIGELSHDYLFSPLAAERISRDLPGIKLLTSLRDPVERTFSHYLQLIRSGRTRAPIEEALGSFPELINNSLYAKHLKVYFRLFPKEDVKILFFDLLRADPRAYAAEVFEFLGLNFVSDIDYERRVLPASRPRSFVLARIAKGMATVVRDLGLPGLVGLVKNSRSMRLLYAPYAEGSRPRPSASLITRIREDTAADVEELERMLGIRLAAWRGVCDTGLADKDTST